MLSIRVAQNQDGTQRLTLQDVRRGKWEWQDAKRSVNELVKPVVAQVELAIVRASEVPLEGMQRGD